jgi:hypothetical protein
MDGLSLINMRCGSPLLAAPGSRRKEANPLPLLGIGLLLSQGRKNIRLSAYETGNDVPINAMSLVDWAGSKAVAGRGGDALKSAPEVLERLWRHRRVAHGIRDRGMSEEVLGPPCIHPPGRQCISRRMP